MVAVVMLVFFFLLAMILVFFFGCMAYLEYTVDFFRGVWYMVCIYKNSTSMRLRNTPSYDAHSCKYMEKRGKDIGVDGKPVLYVSLPKVMRPTPKHPRRRKQWAWYKLSKVLAGSLPRSVLVPSQYKRTCRYKDTKTYRMRDTPSYEAHTCRYKTRQGKDIDLDTGKPRVYIALPKKNRSSKRYHWAWYPYAKYKARNLPNGVLYK